jgi:translation initiation factor 2 beta subunit (eIF-2beta)/eIF-5
MSGKKLETIETTIDEIDNLPFSNKKELEFIFGSQFTFLYLENDKYVPTLVERIGDNITIKHVQIIAPITEKFESDSHDTFQYFMMNGFEYIDNLKIPNSKVVMYDLFNIQDERKQRQLIKNTRDFIKSSTYDLTKGDQYFISARFGKNINHYPENGSDESLYHTLEKTDPQDTDGIILLAKGLSENKISERLELYNNNFKNLIEQGRIIIIKNN